MPTKEFNFTVIVTVKLLTQTIDPMSLFNNFYQVVTFFKTTLFIIFNMLCIDMNIFAIHITLSIRQIHSFLQISFVLTNTSFNMNIIRLHKHLL